MSEEKKPEGLTDEEWSIIVERRGKRLAVETAASDFAEKKATAEKLREDLPNAEQALKDAATAWIAASRAVGEGPPADATAALSRRKTGSKKKTGTRRDLADLTDDDVIAVLKDAANKTVNDDGTGLDGVSRSKAVKALEAQGIATSDSTLKKKLEDMATRGLVEPNGEKAPKNVRWLVK